jgi:hypothetical protein
MRHHADRAIGIYIAPAGDYYRPGLAFDPYVGDAFSGEHEISDREIAATSEPAAIETKTPGHSIIQSLILGKVIEDRKAMNTQSRFRTYDIAAILDLREIQGTGPEERMYRGFYVYRDLGELVGPGLREGNGKHKDCGHKQQTSHHAHTPYGGDYTRESRLLQGFWPATPMSML